LASFHEDVAQAISLIQSTILDLKTLVEDDSCKIVDEKVIRIRIKLLSKIKN